MYELRRGDCEAGEGRCRCFRLGQTLPVAALPCMTISNMAGVQTGIRASVVYGDATTDLMCKAAPEDSALKFSWGVAITFHPTETRFLSEPVPVYLPSTSWPDHSGFQQGGGGGGGFRLVYMS